MAKPIVKQIKLNFESSGLQPVLEMIEKTKEFLGNSPKELKILSDLELRAKSLIKQIEDSEGSFSPEGIKVLKREIDSIATGMVNITRSFSANSKLIDEQTEALKKMNQIEEEIEKRKEKRDEIEKSVGRYDKSGAFRPSSKPFQDIFDSKKAEGENLKSAISGNELTSAVAWRNSLTKVKEIIEGLNIPFQDFKNSTGEAATRAEDIAKAFADNNIRLSVSEILEQFKKLNTIETETNSLREKRVKELDKETKALKGLEAQRSSLKKDVSKIGKEAIQETGDDSLQKELIETRNAIVNFSIAMKEQFSQSIDEYKEKVKEATRDTEDLDDKVNKTSVGPQSTFGKAAKNVFAYGSAYTLLRRIYRETTKTITDLDKAMTDMAVVTKMSRQETWKLLGTFQDLAKQTGMTTTEIANLSTIYFRQGRALKDVIELTEVAAKAARIAGITAEESANYLTSAINGFGLAAKEAESMSDKFAALAASSASSYEELAIGLSKFASQANLAGLSVDFALGLLAKGVETTREAPESIGTALKTVLARMRELTDLGKTMEDGMSVNRVETALRQVGISLRDTNGQFRDMESVLTDVGMKWDTMNRNQKASVAVALAGTRQQSRLVAILQDFDRTLDLVDISLGSSGATLVQHEEHMDGLEAATKALTTSWQQFISTMADTELIKDSINLITGALTSLANIFEKNQGLIRGIIIGLVGLVGVNKIYVAISTIALLIKKKENIEKAKGISLSKAQTAQEKWQLIWAGLSIALTLGKTEASKKLRKELERGTLQWFLYWGAATFGVSILIAALGAIIYAIVKINKQLSEREKLEKRIKELQILRYEAQKLGKELDNLIDKYDVLSKKKIKTEEDVQALRDLEEALKDIDNFEITYDAFTGEVDWNKTMADLEEVRERERRKFYNSYEQEVYELNEFLKNSEEEAYRRYELSASRLVHRIFGDQISQTRLHMTIENSEGILVRNGKMTEAQLKLFKDLYLSYQKDLEKIRRDFFKEFGEDTGEYLISLLDQEGLIETQEDLLDFRNFFEEYLKNNSESFLKILERDKGAIEKATKEAQDFIKQINIFRERIFEKEGLKEQSEAYSSILLELLDLTEGTKEIIEKTLKAENSILDFFNQIFSSNRNYISFFDNFDIAANSLDRISNAASEAGLSVEKLFLGLGEKYQSILEEGFSHSEAQAIALAQLFEELGEDSSLDSLKNSLRDGLLQKTMLELAQETEHFYNNLKRVEEVQDKFLKGDIKQSELALFLQDFSEILSDEKLFDKFKKGEDITLFYIEEEMKIFEEYAQRRILLEKELEMARKSNNKELENSILIELREIKLLSSYRGELWNVTKNQLEYNNLLKEKALRDKMGIQDLEKTKELYESLGRVLGESVIKSYKEIDDILGRGIEDGAIKGVVSDYIQIVNGIPIIISETFQELSDIGRIEIQKYLDALEKQFDNIYEKASELTKNLKNQEKDSLNERKKAYEKYFKDLDRLEDKREKKASREELLEQIQRLEGASDERSRQRAKELRQELNKLDKEIEKDAQTEMRENLLSSIDEEINNLEEKYAEIFTELVNAGEESGEAFIGVLKKYGFMPEDFEESEQVLEEEKRYSSTSSGGGKYPINKASDYALGEGEKNLGFRKSEKDGGVDSFLERDKEVFKEWMKYLTQDYRTYHRPKSFQAFRDYLNEQGFSKEGISEEKILDHLKSKKPKRYSFMIKDKNFMKPALDAPSFSDWWGGLTKGTFEEKFDYPKFRKGGMVDYTGLAMLHGSPGRPEAVLSAEQTVSFKKLIAVLDKNSFSPEGVTIGSITINTNSLDNKQDFRAAGKALAKEFEAAISRRGIGTNTRR